MKRAVLIGILIPAFTGCFQDGVDEAVDDGIEQGIDDEGPITKRTCATDEMDALLRQKHPKLGSSADFEDWLAARMDEPVFKAGVTTIPIVYHIVHNGDAIGSGDNLSDVYLNAQLEQLNNDFRKIAGTSGDNNHPSGADTEVEFSIAAVNRINRSTKGWSAPPYSTNYVENTIKPQSYWDPDQYFNVWVVNMSGGILGYAQFPSQSGLGGLDSNGGAASTDGVVLLTSSLGSTDTPNPAGGAYNQGRTGTHEVGHWLGLRHIWGDGGCSVDDYVGDTPTSDAANYGCPSHNSCGSTDMVENYMDYTDDTCMDTFTNGQKARIDAVLANSPRRQFSGNTGGGGACTGGIAAYPYNEGFESGTGAWSQGSGDDFDWSRDSGGTPSSNTGPSSGSSSTWYMYTESSTPNYSSKTAIFNGPCFDLSDESTATLDFDYHMYGSTNMGSLTLEASADGGSTWTNLWSRSSNQGNSWQSASIDLAGYTGDSVEVRFVGVTGTTWQGDMAVDNIQLSTTGGGNGGNTSTVDLTIVLDNYPEETSWEIRDGSTVVASGGTYGSQPDGSTVVENVDLADGCYDFVINDAYGDGICCSYGSGSYTLENSSGDVLASGGSFGSSDATTFCVP